MQSFAPGRAESESTPAIASDRSNGDPLARCHELLAPDLARFGEILDETLAEQAGYLGGELELYRRGKKLRPILLLLSARLAGPPADGPLADKILRAAVSLEMLHVATLIHDDIVDGAPLRRGLRSVHVSRGTEVAVLIGDMQFIDALRVFSAQVETEEDHRLVRLVLDVGREICRGELDELGLDPGWDTRVLQDAYLRTIDRKTAVMFGLACECGASLAGGGRRELFYLSQFGRHFGRAFQIMDDVFDFLRPPSASGKARGTDLVQRRLSLPIILALAEVDRGHALWRLLTDEACGRDELQAGIDAVLASRGLVECYARARVLALEALGFLAPFPDGPHGRALASLAHYIVDRGAETADLLL